MTDHLNPKELPPLAALREIFTYDPETGHIFRNKNYHKSRAGQPAGEIREGRVSIKVGSVNFYGHRIAWKLHYGEEPPVLIDHVNGVRSDNRIINLRSATMEENGANRSLAANNTSGAAGVRFREDRGKFQASIRANGSLIQLGEYDTIEEAKAARLAGEIILFKQFAASKRLEAGNGH